MRNMIFCLTLTLVLLSGVCTPTLIKAEVLTGQTFPLKAGDDLGREIELLERPRRIVSLAPTRTEILFALGVEENTVGVTEYCNYPAEAKKKQKVGGFADPDIDKILRLKPGLIFVISCDLICRPSPRIAETIEKIAGSLYPERFLSYPQRIISLGPSLTEELFLLGVQDKIVGVTTYCQRPPEVKAKKKVGTVVEVNVERIMSLKPDLVLATL